MRSEWVPLSASALVMGALALVLATLVSPTMGEASSPAETLRVVERDGHQWLVMAIMFFVSAAGLLLGSPAVLTLFTRRGRIVGLLGVVVFAVGLISMAGYAMLMIFFKALVDAEAVVPEQLDEAVADNALSTFLFIFFWGFLLGVVLVAIALFLARRTALWVPAALLVFVVLTPLNSMLPNSASRVVSGLQMMAFVAACTGIAMAATSPGPRPELSAELAS